LIKTLIEERQIEKMESTGSKYTELRHTENSLPDLKELSPAEVLATRGMDLVGKIEPDQTATADEKNTKWENVAKRKVCKRGMQTKKTS